MTKIRFTAELDGNNLCIKREDFINLAESHVIFIELDNQEYNELYEFMDYKYCRKCNKGVVEYTNHNGLCDICEGETNEILGDDGK